MSILITSANSAKAYQLKNRLKDETVILGDYHDLPGFMLNKGNLIQLPNPHSTAYAHKMLTLCLDNAINIIYVLDSNEVLFLQEARQLFTEYDIQLNCDEL